MWNEKSGMRWVCRTMEDVIAIAHARELCFWGVPAKLVRCCLGFSLFIALPAVLLYFPPLGR